MTTLSSPFARRVAGVFATRVAQFVIGFANSFLLARLLGPAGRGAYYLVTLTPSTIFSLGQFGLPSAISFFSGKGRSTRSMLLTSLATGLVLAGVLLAGTWLLLPWLEENVLQAAPSDLVRIALISLPFQFVAAFAGSMLIGRQILRNYNIILVSQSVLALSLTIVVVGVLGLGVAGAVVANLAVAVAGALAVLAESRRVTRSDPSAHESPVHPGELLSYGLKLYPASVTSFFSYRADVYLLGWLLADPVAIGLYSLAVSMAELTFFVPDSVSTVFFPRIAGAERVSANEMAPMVCRFTVLITILSAIGLIPVAYAAVYLILPAFSGSLPAFLVILPGVVALSVSKILSSYVSGLGLPTPIAITSSGALVLNVVANIALIPRFGIVGSSAASLISYTAHATVLVAISTRLSNRPFHAFVVPGRGEWRRLLMGLTELLSRARSLARRAA
jgi:O-antigen/teichoic acid export membrane protein